jgi:NTE family protein
MRAISFVSKLIDQGIIADGVLKRMKIHAISADDVMTGLGVASKLNADWDFLCGLRDTGRARAAAWLDTHFDRIGVASTIDITETYL